MKWGFRRDGLGLSWFICPVCNEETETPGFHWMLKHYGKSDPDMPVIVENG